MQVSRTFPTVAVATIGLSCVIYTVWLLLGAFSVAPQDETTTHCTTTDSEVTSETLKTMLIFALGYTSTLAAKRRHDFARKIDDVVRVISMRAMTAISYATSMVAAARSRTFVLSHPSWVSKDVMAILFTGILCSVCIIGLIISAFTAEVDTEPTEVALASESSTIMRVFTVGWMFILSFKLRRELVSVVGSCCLLQPW